MEKGDHWQRGSGIGAAARSRAPINAPLKVVHAAPTFVFKLPFPPELGWKGSGVREHAAPGV